MLSVGISDQVANIIKNDFKMLVVRRKMTTTAQTASYDEYDFDTDYDTNVSTAESYIDYTGDVDIGIFTRNNPPTWDDFLTYSENVSVCDDLVGSSQTGYAYSCGDESQGSVSGNGHTKWFFDCRQNAVMNLPSYDNSINIIDDGNVYAYDVWLTPFKPYTFAIWVYDGTVYFKWYGNYNPLTPMFHPGGLLSEPELYQDDSYPVLSSTFVSYYSGIIEQRTDFNKPTINSIHILPCKVGSDIGINLNWYLENDDTNNTMCYSLACSNSYTDSTTIEGGTTENDVLWEGILNKYYGGEGDVVDGDTEESPFETTKVLIRERTYLQSTHCYSSDTPYLQIHSTFVDTQGVVDDNWVSDFKGTIKAPFTTFENAFEEHGVDMTYGQINTPVSEFPENHINTTWYTVYNPEDSNSQEVGTYLSTAPTGSSSSGIRGFKKAFGPPTKLSLGRALDPDFATRYNANTEHFEEMFELQFKDDGLVHLYDVFLEEPNNATRPTNCISFAITYNTNFLTENTSGFTQYYCYTPYRISKLNIWETRPIGTDAYELNYGRAYVDHSSNYGYYDNSWRVGYSLPLSTNSDGDYTTSPVCRGLNDSNGEDPPLCYLYVIEAPYSVYDGNIGRFTDKYLKELAFYYPPNDFYPYGHTGTGGSWTQGTLTMCHGLKNNIVVENPMNKGDNGYITKDNPTANQGEGGASEAPEDKGTHDRSTEPTKIIPDKTTNICQTGLISMHKIDSKNLTELATSLFDHNIFQSLENGINKPLDCVLRLCESRIAPKTQSSDKIIKLGIANTTAVGQKVTKDIRTIDCKSVYIKRINGDYTDCMENISIFLPFIGYKDLDGNFLQNKRLHLVYKFNFLNGQCIAYLYFQDMYDNKGKKVPKQDHKQSNETLLTTYTGDFISTLPLGATGNSGLLSTMSAVGLGVMTGNVTFGMMSSLGRTVEGAIPTAQHIGDFGKNNATLINTLKPVLYRYGVNHTRPDDPKDRSKPQKSGGVSGETSYKCGTLSSFHGYVKIKNSNIKIANITEEENNKINELLNNGVWKP